MSDSLEKKILLTLAYSAQFGVPLTTAEVFGRLISAQDTLLSESLVQAKLRELVHKNLLCQKGELYSTRTSDLWVDRKTRTTLSKQKLLEAVHVSEKLKLIPWIMAVGVTGSVAVGNARENDDVDFIIITKQGHLWLSRLVVIALSLLYGKRRSWNHEEENSWCFNLWLDDNCLFFSAQTPIYTAYEFCQAQWLFSRGGVLDALLVQNNWVYSVLPNLYREQAARVAQLQKLSESRVWSAVSIITRWLNAVLFLLQRAYMQQHITNEKVTQSYAFFHPRNTPGILTSGWRGEFESLRERVLKSTPRAIAGLPKATEVLPKVPGRLPKTKDLLPKTGLLSKTTGVLPKKILLQLHSARLKKKTVVLATGVFDVFHSEHANFLKKAQLAGDFLLVGIESDVRVRQIKGEGRPINSQDKRVRVMQAHNIADAVFILPEKLVQYQDFSQVIAEIHPDILAVSSHTKHLDIKRAIMQEVGGEVLVVHEHNPEISSTRSIAKAKKEVPHG
jgi:cytidyltransferase-like protein